MTLPAHQFILASRLTNDVLDNNVTIDSDFMASLNFSKVDQHSIKHWLNKIYSGNSVQLPDIQPANRSHSKSELEARKSDLEEVGDGELLSNGLTRLTLKDFEGPDGLESRTIFSEKGVLVQQLSKKNASKMSKKKRGDKLQSVQDNSTKKKNNR